MNQCYNYHKVIEIYKYLSTESEVRTGKYLPEAFVRIEWRKDEVCAKNQRQILLSTDRENKVNNEFIIWLLLGLLSHF